MTTEAQSRLSRLDHQDYYHWLETTIQRLKGYLQGIFTETDQDARTWAADETGLNLSTFPQDSPCYSRRSPQSKLSRLKARP